MMIKEACQLLHVTKPKIVLGNLVSASGGYFMASGGRVGGSNLLWVLCGIGLMIASACVFNNIIDRDIDKKMVRTRNRVLAKNRMSPASAKGYGTLLGIAGTIVLYQTANLLCTGLVVIGFAIYVVCYSLLLKRTSSYGAFVGSVAGAVPPLAGYCAVTGTFDLGAWILFGIFTFWQMPHCYAVAIYRLEDFTAARIPFLPVKNGVQTTKIHMISHIVLFTGFALLPALTGYTGHRYMGVTAAICFFWLLLSVLGFRTPHIRRWAHRMVVVSILAISTLSVMMAFDTTDVSGNPKHFRTHTGKNLIYGSETGLKTQASHRQPKS